MRAQVHSPTFHSLYKSCFRFHTSSCHSVFLTVMYENNDIVDRNGAMPNKFYLPRSTTRGHVAGVHEVD